MNDRSCSTHDDRAVRLRAAARLLDHLADGEVPDDAVTAVEAAVGVHLGHAGVGR